MGYNSTVVVMNDALDQIRNDPDFGRKLADAIAVVQRGKSVDIRSGYHANAAIVICSRHADWTTYIKVGGNYGEICDKINPDFNEIVDKALKADERKKTKIAQKKLDNAKRN